MDANVRRRRTLEAIVRILIRESVAQPLIVMFEDLHWIDDETQALLNLLAESIGEASILLALNYRPEYRHDWGTRASFTQIRLEPLRTESADEMLAAMLGNDPSIAPLRKLILDKSDATPFFIEEMVQTLFEEGVLTRNGVVRATRSITEIHLPATVSAVLAARIDRLSANEKELLQTLAVIGDEFELALVREVAKISPNNLDSALARLQDAEFIYEQPATDDIEYSFKHSLTRDVTYNSILTNRRKLLHERVGSAIETLYRGSLEEHLRELAHQFEHSANSGRAVEYLSRAARSALSFSSYQEAAEHLRRALEFVSRLPQTEATQRELELQLLAIPALSSVYGYESSEVRAAASRAFELADLLGDSDLSFEAQIGLYWHFWFTGDFERSKNTAHLISARAAESTKPSRMVVAEHIAGSEALHAADYIESRRHLEAGIAVYHSITDRADYNMRSSFADSHKILSYALAILGYLDQALVCARRGLNLARQLYSASDEAWGLVWLMLVHLIRGDTQETRRTADLLESLVEKSGLTQTLPSFAHLGQGWGMASEGLDSHDPKLFDQGLGLLGFESNGPQNVRFTARSLISRLALRAGNTSLALAALNDQDPPQNDGGGGVDIFHFQLCKATAMATKDHATETYEAEQVLRQSIEWARARKAKLLELNATIPLARLLRDTNRRDEARTMLADIYNWFTEGFDTADLKDAKTLLEELAFS